MGVAAHITQALPQLAGPARKWLGWCQLGPLHRGEGDYRDEEGG